MNNVIRSAARSALTWKSNWIR